MSIELKPCPFCGVLPTMRSYTYSTPGSECIQFKVECENDNCPPQPTVDWHYWTAEEAAEAWNTRAERTCRAIPHDNLNESEGMGDAWEICSECGAVLAVITDNQPPPNYCPDCGAKVVEQ